MTALIAPSNSDYLLDAHPRNLYQKTIECLSDLEFCKTEFSFLTKLIDKSCLYITDNKKLNELSMLEKKVNSLSLVRLGEIRNALVLHEHQLSMLDVDKLAQDEKKVLEEHTNLSKKVNQFVESVRKIKKEIVGFVKREQRVSKKGK